MRMSIDQKTGYITVQTKRRQDKQEHDVRVRTLIGARLRREEVERYKALAEKQGVSLYAWVREALREAEREQTLFG